MPGEFHRQLNYLLSGGQFGCYEASVVISEKLYTVDAACRAAHTPRATFLQLQRRFFPAERAITPDLARGNKKKCNFTICLTLNEGIFQQHRVTDFCSHTDQRNIRRSCSCIKGAARARAENPRPAANYSKRGLLSPTRLF